MGSDTGLHAGKNESLRCVKCGTCQAVCPVFSVRPDESSAARGKMALAEAVDQGHLDPSKTYRAYMEKCLLCGACEETCPNEVKTLTAMLDAREKLAENGDVKAGKKMILKQVVGEPRILDLAMRAGRFFQGLVFRRIPADSGIRRRFPLPLIARERSLPRLARKFLTDRFSGLVKEGPGPKVGVFAGCMTNYFYPRAGEGMIELLSRQGASVYVPSGQVCCGMPALTGGARDVVRDLACRNLEAFEQYDLDFIVTGCASCGGNLKENYGRLLAEAGIEEERIRLFSDRTLDINEFLHRYGAHAAGDAGRDEGPERLKVTYHHPCHLGRLQGVKDQPIDLITSLEGVRYIPMADPDRCCGMGGSFSLENYEISKEVNDQKIARILETGADAVITSCPACIMHIRDGLNRSGRQDIQVLHITELLDSCKRAEEDQGLVKDNEGPEAAETLAQRAG